MENGKCILRASELFFRILNDILWLIYMEETWPKTTLINIIQNCYPELFDIEYDYTSESVEKHTIYHLNELPIKVGFSCDQEEIMRSVLEKAGIKNEFRQRRIDPFLEVEKFKFPADELYYIIPSSGKKTPLRKAG